MGTHIENKRNWAIDMSNSKIRETHNHPLPLDDCLTQLERAILNPNMPGLKENTVLAQDLIDHITDDIEIMIALAFDKTHKKVRALSLPEITYGPHRVDLAVHPYSVEPDLVEISKNVFSALEWQSSTNIPTGDLLPDVVLIEQNLGTHRGSHPIVVANFNETKAQGQYIFLIEEVKKDLTHTPSGT